DIAYSAAMVALCSDKHAKINQVHKSNIAMHCICKVSFASGILINQWHIKIPSLSPDNAGGCADYPVAEQGFITVLSYWIAS
ncbi:hypothetical protein, partial [Photobacterium sp. R1]